MLNSRMMNSKIRSQSPKMIWWSTCILIFLVGCALAPILKVDVTETQHLPRSPEEFKELTKNITCPYGKYPQYVTSSSYNKTYIVCWINQTVFGTCWEYNEGGQIVQPNVVADCTKYPLSPCSFPYPSTDSYKFFVCFERYGGMLSPRQQAKMLQDYPAALQKLNEALGTARQEAKKHQDCKEDLESTRKQLNACFIAFGVHALFLLMACVLLLKRKKLIQMWERWRNSGTENLGLNAIDKTSTEGNAKTENKIDEEGDIEDNEPNQLDSLINNPESNDYPPMSEAVTATEENQVSTRETTDISLPFVVIGTENRIRQEDMDRAIAKQQKTNF